MSEAFPVPSDNVCQYNMLHRCGDKLIGQGDFTVSCYVLLFLEQSSKLLNAVEGSHSCMASGTFRLGNWLTHAAGHAILGVSLCISCLQVIISSADAVSVRPIAYQGEAYNTQGRSYLTPYTAPTPSSFYVTADLWIPLPWATVSPTDASLNRRAELWTRITDSNDPNTGAFNIIGFVRLASTCTQFSPGWRGAIYIYRAPCPWLIGSLLGSGESNKEKHFGSLRCSLSAVAFCL